MSIPLIRPVRGEDFDQILRLAAQSGGGMTNLPNDPRALQARIDKAIASFAANAEGPGEEVYLMVLEQGGAVIGTTAVFSCIGLESGFVNYKVSATFHASEQLNKRIQRRLLVPCHDYTGASEVASLFLSPDVRGGGYGKLLARSRYLFIAQKPDIIADPVVAELRGWRAPDGTQPFWEAIGRHFFDMDFEDADVHNSAAGNQFIADLMPRFPIYVVLLPEAARDCIGRPHDNAAPAFEMLLNEGFRFKNYIDIFDGGPLVSAEKGDIRTIRDSRLASVRIGTPRGQKRLVSAGAVASFRCVAVAAEIEEEEIVIDRAAAEALGVEPGAVVRFIEW